jgi:hypothetical protein
MNLSDDAFQARRPPPGASRRGGLALCGRLPKLSSGGGKRLLFFSVPTPSRPLTSMYDVRAWPQHVNFGPTFGVRNDFPLVRYAADGALWTTAVAICKALRVAPQTLRDLLNTYKTGIRVEDDAPTLRVLKEAGVVQASATRVQLVQLRRLANVAAHMGYPEVERVVEALRAHKPQPPAVRAPVPQPAAEAGPSAQPRGGGSVWPPGKWTFPTTLPFTELDPQQAKVNCCTHARCGFCMAGVHIPHKPFDFFFQLGAWLRCMMAWLFHMAYLCHTGVLWLSQRGRAIRSAQGHGAVQQVELRAHQPRARTAVLPCCA